MLLLCLLTHQQTSSSLTLFFVRCEQHETTLKVKECMQQQWSDIIRPGHKVKVKVNLTSEVVESLTTLLTSPQTVCTFTQQQKLMLFFKESRGCLYLTVSTSYYLLYLLLHLCTGVLYIYIYIVINISASFLSNLGSL